MAGVRRSLLASILSLGMVIAGLAGATPASATGPCRPTVHALPGLGGTFAEVKGLNHSGVAVGTAQNQRGDVKAVQWDRAGRIHVIETGSALADSALDINESGVVVGIADDLELGLPRGWYKAPGRRVLFLPVPRGVIASYAARVNSARVVTGYVFFANETFAPAVWKSPAALPTLLARRPGYPQGIAFGINNAGTVVGGLGTPAGEFVPARWPKHRPPVLLRIGGAAVPGMANDVNGAGQVAGTVTTPSTGREQAVRWRPDGSAQLLGWLPGGATSNGLALSSRGRVTGRADDRSGTPRAFVWTGSGPLRALPSLIGGGATTGNAVVDHGRGLVGGSSDANGGVTRAVLWRCPFGR